MIRKIKTLVALAIVLAGIFALAANSAGTVPAMDDVNASAYATEHEYTALVAVHS